MSGSSSSFDEEEANRGELDPEIDPNEQAVGNLPYLQACVCVGGCIA